jgi:hypothetical protein
VGRMTLRLPESLHRQLEAQAEIEGVSLNQYIVYMLAQRSTPSYMVHAVSMEAVAEQRERYETLHRNLRKGTPEEIKRALDEREPVEPELELTPEIVERLQQRIAEARRNESFSTE